MHMTPGQAATMELLKQHPAGLARTDLAQRLSLSPHYQGKVLRQLRDAGLVACSAAGRSAVWCLTSTVQAVIDARLARQPSYAAIRRAERRAASASAIARFSDDPVQHLTIRAGASPPPPTTAPRTVFQLATMEPSA